MHEAESRARRLRPRRPICRSRASAICVLRPHGRKASRAWGHPHTGDVNLSPPPPSLPTSGSSLSPTLAFSSISHTPLPLPLGFYIYFLLSVFSVCTIPWGCDRGEGAGHVGITSVYVPRPPAPPSWAPAPSSRQPRGEGWGRGGREAREEGHTCILMTRSPCGTAETNTTL